MSKQKFNFETNIKELEKYLEKLENPETGLDESIDLFKKGMDIIGKCSEKLNEAELEIKKITEN
jgi:exodeoxyribonuclease VII small subunit